MDTYSNEPENHEGNELNSRDRKVKILTISLAVILVALIGITYFFLSRYEQTPEEATNTEPVISETIDGTPLQTNSGPQVTVSQWESQVTPPPAPASMTVYQMKQNYTPAEAQAIALRLSANAGIEQKDDEVIAYSETGDHLMIMDLKSGEYGYRSTVGVSLPVTGSENESVYTFLRELGMYDDTIKVTASYRKRSEPGIKYVELHRSWDEVQMPILNDIGLINIPESVKLAQLSLTRPASNVPSDADIYGTSDGTNGLARRADFNTVTVGISEADNTVREISSNVRILTPTQTTVSGVAQSEVLAALQTNRQSMLFTSPAGEGLPDFEKVYPGNQAIADNATITDIGLAYIENMPGVVQTTLVPHYVVRGFMESNNGYRLNFVATVPAGSTPQARFKIPQVRIPFLSALVGVVQAQEAEPTTAPGVEDPGQKQGTLTFPTGSPQLELSAECYPQESDLVAGSAREIGGVRIGKALRPDDNPDEKEYEWYYMNRAGRSQQQILADVQNLLQELGSKGRDKLQELIWDIQEIPDCPIRFTGDSPTIFAYGSPGTQMSISVDRTLTYAEPAAKQNNWDVVIGQQGLEVNGLKRTYVYYEYEAADFTRPEKGWVVSRTQLDSLARVIAGKMEMNAVEAVRLNFELNHALADVSSDRVFVGMIDRAELDAKLPIQVSPVPEAVARYHFYVGAADGAVEAPALTPIDRQATMVLEIGAAN